MSRRYTAYRSSRWRECKHKAVWSFDALDSGFRQNDDLHFMHFSSILDPSFRDDDLHILHLTTILDSGLRQNDTSKTAFTSQNHPRKHGNRGYFRCRSAHRKVFVSSVLPTPAFPDR